MWLAPCVVCWGWHVVLAHAQSYCWQTMLVVSYNSIGAWRDCHVCMLCHGVFVAADCWSWVGRAQLWFLPQLGYVAHMWPGRILAALLHQGGYKFEDGVRETCKVLKNVSA